MINKFYSKISIGTANFGQIYSINKIKVNKKEIFKILDVAKKNKINSIDTSQNYGVSEKLIGEYIKKRKSKRWQITTKIINEKKEIKNLITKSKERLSIMPANLLVHKSSHLTNDKFRKELIDLKKRNKIKIGVSVYETSEINKVLEQFVPDIIQLPINILNNKFFANGLLKMLKEKNIIIQARSIFFQGLLFKKDNFIKSKNKKLYNLIKKLKIISKKNNTSLAELSLLFVNSIQEIDKIVIGVNNSVDLKNNIKICKKNLPKKILDEILDTGINRLNFTKIIQNLK